jgi:hypothetical protein
MTPAELSELSTAMRQAAVWIDEIRFLRLEQMQRMLNRPALGAYLRARAGLPKSHPPTIEDCVPLPDRPGACGFFRANARAYARKC